MVLTRFALAPDASSVADARAVVRSTCREWLGDAPACDAATLLASELVTNAVLHARTPMSLAVERRGETMRVSVRDFHPALPRARRYNLDSATGRGLRLLETMASAWGVEVISDAEQPGKVVWFEIPLQTPVELDESELAEAFADVMNVDWLTTSTDL